MWNVIATRTIPRAPIDSNTSNEERAAIKGTQCASAPTTFHFLAFAWPEPSTSNTAMIVSTDTPLASVSEGCKVAVTKYTWRPSLFRGHHRQTHGRIREKFVALLH